MSNVFIFGGTTEGRKLAIACELLGIPAYVSVASEYGSDVLGELKVVKVLEGRMNIDEMSAGFKALDISVVYDATHPFATVVKENIKSACEQNEIEYIRVLRNITDIDSEDYKLVKSVDEAVDYLTTCEGNVFVATGSKEIAKYKKLDLSRVYARVLSAVESINACKDIGLEGSHIIAMQGPFSERLNIALMEEYNCKYMVSKQTGNNGGFDEKIEACKQAGVYPIIVALPQNDKGISEEEAIEHIAKRHNIENYKDILTMCSDNDQDNGRDDKAGRPYKLSIVGIGPGSMEYVNAKARKLISDADIIVAGSDRMLELSDEIRKEEKNCKEYTSFKSYKTIDIINFIKEKFENSQDSSAVVLMSGDTGFYSGTQSLYKHIEAMAKNSENILHKVDMQIVPSISSISYLASRYNISWHDMKIVSLHGRTGHLAHELKTNKKVFVISSGGMETSDIISELIDKGFEDCDIYIGENMSYPEEVLSHGKVADFKEHKFLELCSMIIINQNASPMHMTLGIEDDEFIRDKVPMTKSEIRALSVAKLGLSSEDICYDVGAGTGSVSIEMAMNVPKGKVYAIEKKTIAADLIYKNIEKFGLDNVEVIKGEASVSMEEIEAPDAVFIGGTTGKLRDILKIVFEKNPKVRVVVTAVSLESVAEINEACKYYETLGCKTDIVLVSVSNTKRVMNYTMFDAKNPVLIASIKG
jgi:precorrin-6A reductase